MGRKQYIFNQSINIMVDFILSSLAIGEFKINLIKKVILFCGLLEFVNPEA